MPFRSRTLALSLAAATLLSGCKYAAALSKREYVVVFDVGATQDQHRQVLAACATIPHVVPEPMGNGTMVSELASNVRFRVDKASDADLGRLLVCFHQFSFVKTVDVPDLSH